MSCGFTTIGCLARVRIKDVNGLSHNATSVAFEFTLFGVQFHLANTAFDAGIFFIRVIIYHTYPILLLCSSFGVLDRFGLCQILHFFRLTSGPVKRAYTTLDCTVYILLDAEENKVFGRQEHFMVNKNKPCTLSHTPSQHYSFQQYISGRRQTTTASLATMVYPIEQTPSEQALVRGHSQNSLLPDRNAITTLQKTKDGTPDTNDFHRVPQKPSTVLV